MLLNYIRLALRLLLRNPFFSIINILGLAIGFTSFFALWQYSSSELKTDQQYRDFERIARIGFDWTSTNAGRPSTITFGITKASIPPQIKDDFPEVESFVRISEQAGFFQNDLHGNLGTRIVVAPQSPNNEARIFKETQIAYADQNIFNFFTIPLLEGDPETVLAGANFVALSQTTTKKYFGDDNPIGKNLTLNDSITLKVTGVYENMLHNSRLHYDMIISNEGLLTQWSNVYWGGTLNFVKLNGTTFKDFETKVNTNKKKYFNHILNGCNECDVNAFVQPLKDIAFSQGFIADEAVQQKSKTLLITLGSIAIIVLIMAWINYVNLSIARLTNRMREFATRKANGATSRDLIVQFLIEATLINIIAVGLAVTFLQFIRGPLETFLAIYITSFSTTGLSVWMVLIISMVTGILITGLYPAYVCLKRHPQNLFIIKATSQKSLASTLLTTFQFATATVLILWVFVIYLQLNYILHKDTGFARDGIVVVESPVIKQVNYEKQLQTFADQLKSIPSVNDVTFSRFMIGDPGNKPGGVKMSGSENNAGAESNGVEENFIPFFNLKLLAGRNFIKDDRSDVVIISSMVVSNLGFENPEDALGSKVTVNTGDWNVNKEAEVIGVIADYRRYPLFDYSKSNTMIAKGGTGLFLTHKNTLFPELIADNIAIRLKMDDRDQSIASIDALFKSIFPGNVLEWRFLDDRLNQAYAYEKVTRNQILLFTLLAIVIACLGLVAMMSQKIVDKIKEIGIRKILGASIEQIGRLLIRATIVQLLFASLVGIPLAYYLGTAYLQKYSERITLIWWYFAIPIAIFLVIMIASISTMLWKAVRTNPVESLRSE